MTLKSEFTLKRNKDLLYKPFKSIGMLILFCLLSRQCPLTLMTPMLRIILDEVRIASKKTPNEFGYKSDESGEFFSL